MEDRCNLASWMNYSAVSSLTPNAKKPQQSVEAFFN